MPPAKSPKATDPSTVCFHILLSCVCTFHSFNIPSTTPSPCLNLTAPQPSSISSYIIPPKSLPWPPGGLGCPPLWVLKTPRVPQLEVTWRTQRELFLHHQLLSVSTNDKSSKPNSSTQLFTKCFKNKNLN